MYMMYVCSCRCLLTSLTGGDHVILFAPPIAFGYQWRKVCSLYCCHSDHVVVDKVKVISEALRNYWSCSYGNSQSYNFHELDRRRELLSITSFIWLPNVVRSHTHHTAVMVVTTKTGHIIFIHCVFDLLKG